MIATRTTPPHRKRLLGTMGADAQG
jgi:hypothetical protein